MGIYSPNGSCHGSQHMHPYRVHDFPIRSLCFQNLQKARGEMPRKICNEGCYDGLTRYGKVLDYALIYWRHIYWRDIEIDDFFIHDFGYLVGFCLISETEFLKEMKNL
ncbi:uncharacterized protein LOC106777906 [Vigna radiata var. radiata]|uniref:Uncharacterized protein LOC106777906 n=1 Tax=Vigna radiata var. radiata TaxID=3916 RepID=A0A3Q0ERT1_VIGRR|nr:uncharacterized protein LOC106777906 [Vigna radiata var. radiata]